MSAYNIKSAPLMKCRCCGKPMRVHGFQDGVKYQSWMGSCWNPDCQFAEQTFNLVTFSVRTGEVVETYLQKNLSVYKNLRRRAHNLY